MVKSQVLLLDHLEIPKVLTVIGGSMGGMQVLAWMWCIAFSSYFSSMWIFGITAIAHIIILAAIAVTVATFETARRKPDFFLRSDGYHTTSRSRYIYYNGKRYERDPQDMGGEHE